MSSLKPTASRGLTRGSSGPSEHAMGSGPTAIQIKHSHTYNFPTEKYLHHLQSMNKDPFKWKKVMHRMYLVPLCTSFPHFYVSVFLFFYIIWIQQLSFTLCEHFHDEWINRNDPKLIEIKYFMLTSIKNVCSFYWKAATVEIRGFCPTASICT